MKKTTLIYLEKDGCFLMLLRNKKKNDCNEGKWIGVGGKFEKNETPEECIKREVLEETGLTLLSMHFYGVIEFRSDSDEDEDMYLFTSDEFSGETSPDKIECNEGTLKWIPKCGIMSLNLWEGDRYFLKKILAGQQKINMRLVYNSGRIADVKEYNVSVND